MVRMAESLAYAVGVCCLLLLLTPVPGVAQGSSQGSITLRATVATNCAISLSTANATLDLNVGAGTSIAVATVDERCNAANGYTVSLTSKNGGSLSSGTANIAYTLQYGDASSSNGSLSANRDVSGTGRQSVLSVSVPASDERQAGTYEDTVTISIAAK